MNRKFATTKAHIWLDKLFPHRGRAYEWLKRNTGKMHIHDLNEQELGEVNKKLDRLARKKHELQNI